MKVNTWITGIMIPGNYTTDMPDGALLGWDADWGDIVALDGVLVTVADYRAKKGKRARILKPMEALDRQFWRLNNACNILKKGRMKAIKKWVPEEIDSFEAAIDANLKQSSQLIELMKLHAK